MDACRILVVDDEPDLEQLVLQRMRREIRGGRYSFVFARNGVEALERLSGDDEIDIVITDINMPETDGSTLLRQIRPFVKFIPWTQDSRWSPFAIPEAS